MERGSVWIYWLHLVQPPFQKVYSTYYMFYYLLIKFLMYYNTWYYIDTPIVPITLRSSQ